MQIATLALLAAAAETLECPARVRRGSSTAYGIGSGSWSTTHRRFPLYSTARASVRPDRPVNAPAGGRLVPPAEKTSRWSPWVLVAACFIGQVVVPAEAEDFELAGQGCPMAHCDSRMSDFSNAAVPPSPVTRVWQRDELSGEQAGSRMGLGCVGNGSVAVCSYASSIDAVVMYDYEGNRVWTSGDLFAANAWTSAPMVSDDGEVIMTDGQTIARIDAAGGIIWQSALTHGGRSVSPVIRSRGVVVVVTDAGPIYAFDSADGRLLDVLFIDLGMGDPGYFVSRNTPAVRGNRLYVSMHHQVGGVPDPDFLARLVAIDVDRSGTEVLRKAWHYEFGGLSGASPLRVGYTIFFDGNRPEPSAGPDDPHMFAVRDTPSGPKELWRIPLVSPAVASFAQDPRPWGGVWSFSNGSPALVLRRFFTGKPKEQLNINELLGVGGDYVVTGVLNIAGTDAEPVMMVSVTDRASGNNQLLAIDLASRSLRWNVEVAHHPDDIFVGQTPVLNGPWGPRIVLTTRFGGALAFGAQAAEAPSQAAPRARWQ